MMDRTQLMQHCILKQYCNNKHGHAPGGKVNTVAVVQIDPPVELPSI